MATENHEPVVYFLIPVYNESQNIPLLFENLTKHTEGLHAFFLFVDDASKDNTITEIKKYFNKNEYHILTKDKNHGPGHSFNIGFEWLISRIEPEDFIVTIEADNTSDLTILNKMIVISQLGYDMVLASVYAQGGGLEKTNILRKIISFVANMVFRLIFNIKVLTLSSFYRVYKPSLLIHIKEHYGNIIENNGFISMLEILIKAIHLKASIIEVPMILKSDQRTGKSKMKIFRTFLSYLKFLITYKFFRK